MKKTVSIVLALICLVGCCISASASVTEQTIITINNVDVVFNSSSSLSNEEKQVIATILTNGEPNTQTYGLLCTLFGHNNSTEIVTTITHCASSTAPRCLREKWEVVTCSRCGNVENTRIDYTLIYCCS